MLSESKRQKQANRKSFARYIKKLQLRERRYVALRDQAARIHPLQEANKELRRIIRKMDELLIRSNQQVVVLTSQNKRLSDGEELTAATKTAAELREKIKALEDKMENINRRKIDRMTLKKCLHETLQGVNAAEAYAKLFSCLCLVTDHYVNLENGEVLTKQTVQNALTFFAGRESTNHAMMWLMKVAHEHWVNYCKAYQSVAIDCNYIPEVLKALEAEV